MQPFHSAHTLQLHLEYNKMKTSVWYATIYMRINFMSKRTLGVDMVFSKGLFLTTVVVVLECHHSFSVNFCDGSWSWHVFPVSFSHFYFSFLKVLFISSSHIQCNPCLCLEAPAIVWEYIRKPKLFLFNFFATIVSLLTYSLMGFLVHPFPVHMILIQSSSRRQRLSKCLFLWLFNMCLQLFFIAPGKSGGTV